MKFNYFIGAVCLPIVFFFLGGFFSDVLGPDNILVFISGYIGIGFHIILSYMYREKAYNHILHWQFSFIFLIFYTLIFINGENAITAIIPFIGSGSLYIIYVILFLIQKQFTLEQIKQAHSQVKSGADFPKYIQDMKNLGVTSYQVSVRDGQVAYSGVDNFQISTTTGIDPLIISPISDSEKFKSDLKNHQQGNTDYHTFCEDCAKSGIEKWIMNLSNMTCTYYDSLGNEILVEKIPS